eukprot:TRINITY_DN23637_c0_g1_i1.p1 TRINITY_DN23637_c0_g1~~TRINITY_DN23637_c0_g1_i1.p1  ORF type:complete len:367 (-),score=110.95 TRINITY_DN23637_c0_g1_i1:137-1237(-)
MSSFSNAIILCLLFTCVFGTPVTLRNDELRVDTDGNIIDCHTGMLLFHNGTWFLYGERYEDHTGMQPPWPQLHVYTSPDLTTWTHQGPMLNGNPVGSFMTPYVVYNKATQMFVGWFNGYVGGCCSGGFGVSKSPDGIHFDIVTTDLQPKYPSVDCNGLFVDDDGTGYVLYSSLSADHKQSIAKLTPDYLGLSGENYGLFPDRYVEGSGLFKRNGVYYVMYGSCCCFCRGGSGQVVYTATNITGPWVRQAGFADQGTDINCYNSSLSLCGAYGDVVAGDIIVPAQGIYVSTLPSADGPVYLWTAERWLSAPFNNPTCPDECQPQQGQCAVDPRYVKGHGFPFWYPLQFDDNGRVLQLTDLASFTINI